LAFLISLPKHRLPKTFYYSIYFNLFLNILKVKYLQIKGSENLRFPKTKKRQKTGCQKCQKSGVFGTQMSVFGTKKGVQKGQKRQSIT
jgi:hypothetical protein